MTDLNDFFAKKDRKKKRAASKSSQTSVPTHHEAAGQNDSAGKVETASRGNGSSQQPNTSDDGWIEIEDPRGSQVYTGGRTVTEMKRYVVGLQRGWSPAILNREHFYVYSFETVF